MLFDVRLPGYPLALAGGGNLAAFDLLTSEPKSGAGIGVTRIAECTHRDGDARTRAV